MKRQDIVFLDGAMGTKLWEKAENKVPVWRYNIENPAIVSEVTREYVEAGSEIVQANTFGANRYAVKTAGYAVGDVVEAGVRMAKEAAGSRAKVSLSVGPLPVLMEPYGDLTEEEAAEAFDEQIAPGVAAGADLIAFETFMDADMMRVAVEAAARHGLPILATMTFTEVGKTIMGHSVEYFVEAMEGLPVEAVGLNCSLGPEKAVPIIAQFGQYTDLPLILKPNAGRPITENGQSRVEYDIDTFVSDCLPALDYNVKYIGGCCGSNPDYIRALIRSIRG
ncbi:MAG: homocysteine S-methyltransferase family protein [Clostridia bacterium]|nr:homocysteine S-methyltransferase family protein [Clostridia bacterium]MBO4885610.1 homocysteine S-methyltransferase family protein [Clostridia bacterium]